MDLNKVHYDPATVEEENRMIARLTATEVVCDVFGGMGSFAIRSTLEHKGLRVVTNDPNFYSYFYCK